MKLKIYYEYFRFIHKFWDLKLALFTIWHEIRGEGKYRINTTGTEQLWPYDIDEDDLEISEAYQPSSYYILEKVFDALPAEAGAGRICDYGCGKGRTLAVAMRYGFTKLTGIDIIHEFIKDSEENLLRSRYYKPGFDITLTNNRAQDELITNDTTVFLFFNPFKEEVMEEVVDNIMMSYREKPRTLYIIYINDVYRHLFLDKGFEQIFRIEKLTYLQATIMRLPG